MIYTIRFWDKDIFQPENSTVEIEANTKCEAAMKAISQRFERHKSIVHSAQPIIWEIVV